MKNQIATLAQAEQHLRSIGMVHYIYGIILTTNHNENFKYIGKHSTKDLNDGYFSSGVLINLIGNRHDVKVERNIIRIASNKSHAMEIETNLIHSEWFSNPDYCLNIACTGNRTNRKLKLLKYFSGDMSVPYGMSDNLTPDGDFTFPASKLRNIHNPNRDFGSWCIRLVNTTSAKLGTDYIVVDEDMFDLLLTHDVAINSLLTSGGKLSFIARELLMSGLIKPWLNCISIMDDVTIDKVIMLGEWIQTNYYTGVSYDGFFE